MSAEIVNLRLARKAKRRADAADAAAVNRARSSRSRQTREAEARHIDRAARHLDQHRIEAAPHEDVPRGEGG